MFYKFLFYLIWPFGAWIYSVLHAKEKSSYVIFFLFSILLCWHMAPVNMNTYYDDFLGILERFQQTNLTTSDFLLEVKRFITFSSDAPKELYEHFLTWLIKLFTDNYHFFFLLASIPVALFQLRSLRLIASDDDFYSCFYGVVALMMMILPRDIITVQNPRFTTGYWLFITCSLYFFSTSKKNIKYLMPLILLPAIHSAMWVALIMTALFLVLPVNKRVLEIMAIISIPFIFIDPNISEYFDFNILPENLVAWTRWYVSDESYSKFILHEGRSGFWWVSATFTVGLKLVYVILALQVILNKKKVECNEESRFFYTFFLFSFFFINMIQFVPVLGQRYFYILQVFIFYEWYKTFHFSRKNPYLWLLFFYSWRMLQRYGYFLGGALSVNMPPDIFFTPLPYLIGKGFLW